VTSYMRCSNKKYAWTTKLYSDQGKHQVRSWGHCECSGYAGFSFCMLGAERQTRQKASLVSMQPLTSKHAYDRGAIRTGNANPVCIEMAGLELE
jgi:hypothetical protein